MSVSGYRCSNERRDQLITVIQSKLASYCSEKPVTFLEPNRPGPPSSRASRTTPHYILIPVHLTLGTATGDSLPPTSWSKDACHVESRINHESYGEVEEKLRSPLKLGGDADRRSEDDGLLEVEVGATYTRDNLRFSDIHTSTKDATLAIPHVKDPLPVTLAEMDAEFLHFIAQKELNLAVHEAELLELKRKWERIVNRGFGKSLSPGDANTHSTSPNGSLLLASSPSPSSSQSHTTPNFPLSGVLSPTATTPGAAVVFEGIKEGIQGVSMLIAAGLESIVQVNAADVATDKTPEQSNPIPFRLGSAPHKQHQRKANGHIYVHGQNESQSSSSTAVSAVSSGTFSLSLSSPSRL
ncbi:hypothetical protein D9613_008809 [Agrocybe pediades]|uniref:Uncharacterized protein n=1 Tax=Agrocybe pediades TaxID=84607 RepID=A0A8H4VNC7_9AGAR|nr:hypothetical protein D9613_008809 [Agrocybe pediades]